MTRTQVDVDGVVHTVNFDDPRPRGAIFQSIVLAQLTDELTGRPIGAPVQVVCALANTRARSGSFGVCGVVGRPVQLFPMLSSQSYVVDARFTADGFQPIDVAAPIALQPNFPDDFIGANLGELALRRNPVLVEVRTVSLDAQLRTQPVPGATVEVTGIWRRSDDLGNPPAVAAMISVGTGLYESRPIGSTAEPVVVSPIGEPARSLLTSASVGDRRVVVDRGGAVAAGDVVSIDSADSDRAEIAEVESVAAPADASSPATLTLRFAIRRPHSTGVVVERVTVAPSGPAAALTSAGRHGDATLFVNSMTSFTGPTHVRVASGGVADEFHLVQPYAITSGPHGYGRFPLLGRVVAIQLSATAGALGAGPITFTLDYGVAHNATHITLT